MVFLHTSFPSESGHFLLFLHAMAVFPSSGETACSGSGHRPESYIVHQKETTPFGVVFLFGGPHCFAMRRCGAYERKAFADGLPYGANLILELFSGKTAYCA